MIRKFLLIVTLFAFFGLNSYADKVVDGVVHNFQSNPGVKWK